jgi:hypothetical protein
LSFTVGLIAEAVLRRLNRETATSTHALWIGRYGPLKVAGGDWSSRWRSTVGFRDEGGFVIDLPWPDSASMPMIAAEAAE